MVERAYGTSSLEMIFLGPTRDSENLRPLIGIFLAAHESVFRHFVRCGDSHIIGHIAEPGVMPAARATVPHLSNGSYVHRGGLEEAYWDVDLTGKSRPQLGLHEET